MLRSSVCSRAIFDRGKIEPRRNHLALSTRDGSQGQLSFPHLRIVGQTVEISQVPRRLRSTLNEQNTVKWLRQVTDRELTLYANASFVARVAEGWGLPSVSLAHGIPC